MTSSISPLKEDWRRDPRLDWFNQNTLTSDTIRILAALKLYEKKALYCIRNNFALLQLSDAMGELASFLYLINLRLEKSYRPRYVEKREIERFKKLINFANTMNAIQVRIETSSRLIDRVSDLFTTIAAIQEVRVVIAVAVLAGVFMVLGTSFFNIPASSAFLTWFSVVFGSITISVGITYVVARRGK